MCVCVCAGAKGTAFSLFAYDYYTPEKARTLHPTHTHTFFTQ